MRKLKNLSAIFFTLIVLVLGSCSQDETMDEIEVNIESTYDPGEEGDPPGGGD